MKNYVTWSVPIIRVLNWMLTIISLVAIISLIINFGFYLSSHWSAVIERVDLIIVLFYVLQYSIKLILSQNKLKFFKQQWIETLLTFLIVIQAVLLAREFGWSNLHQYFFEMESQLLTKIYLGAMQVLVFMTFIVGVFRFNPHLTNLKFHPAQAILISFFLVILIGTFMLLLPKATNPSHHLSFIDALFTATSATCVTGLIVVDTGSFFSPLGQTIILILIQIGGLSIMTLSSFIAIFFRQGISVRDRVVLREMINVEKIGIISKTLRSIIVLTFAIELVGMLLLMLFWSDQGWSLKRLVYYSTFHSISAFCNAGFSTFSDSIMRFHTDIPVVMTFSILIIIGGLGFIVLSDLTINSYLIIRGQKVKRLPLHTKIVIIITGILLAVGFIAFFFLDFNGQPNSFKAIAAFFNSVTARTAGFNTVDIAQLTMPSVWLLIVLMFIGASPGSTGGGVKTTTFGILWATLISIVLGRKRVNLFKKNVPYAVINRALAVFLFSGGIIILSTFILTITETGDFLNILFEEVSAFGTVGLSQGLTPYLTKVGKIVIIISMFIGRTGPLTMASAIVTQQGRERIEYPSEYLMIG